MNFPSHWTTGALLWIFLNNGAPAQTALQFDGSNDSVTFGAATATLGASNFTLECWFRKTVPNSYAYTGAGGIYAQPLITKGRSEGDGSNVDCNYFFGISTNGGVNVLGADFEGYHGGTNYPVVGRTRILDDVWYHGAATYDGAMWSLYLNGKLETNKTVGALPRYDSIQHAAVGTALNSSGGAGSPAGYFRGTINEVRIWNHARSQTEIRATMYHPLTNTPTGLLGRWALNDGTGTTAVNSVVGSPNGALTNGPQWTNSTPFVFVPAGATWKYLDNGSNPGASWVATNFDDSGWASGPAPLGYGDPWIVTTHSYGGAASNKYVTTYYRTTFVVTNPADYGALHLGVIRDDSVAVYLNGVGIYTNRLPGTFNHLTYADSPGNGGTDETTWVSGTLPVSVLVPGTNVVAAEVHQVSATSSDVTFVLEFSGDPPQNSAPVVTLTSPTNGATGVALDAPLRLTVNDPEAGTVNVALHGRLAGGTAPGADFTIVALPDTQFYSETYSNQWEAQVNWIINNRTNLNIVYIGHLGDIVNQGDSQPYQWNAATNALYKLLNPALTGTPDGIPLGVVPGNHDHVGGTTLYNQFLGLHVFTNRSWWGGHYGGDNQNHYDVFTASGMNFIALFTDFNYANINYGPIDAWANGVLATHANRRAIIFTHCILTTSGAYDSNRSPNLYSTVGTNQNTFLMLCGHNHGEARRTETNGSHVVHIALSDYQAETPQGGNGWLRLYKFSPANNVIHVETYSPTLNSNKTASSSQFDIPYDMSGATSAEPFFVIGTTNVPSGATLNLTWPGLSPGANYEWFAVVSDGTNSVSSSTNQFATTSSGTNTAPAITLTTPADGAIVVRPTNVTLTATASDTEGFVARVEFYAGAGKIGTATNEPWNMVWNNPAAGVYSLTARAIDSGGLPAVSPAHAVTVTNAPTYTNLLIAAGSTWKYLDNGSNQGTTWTATNFNDTAWASGPAPLGYGDPWIVTTNSYGGDAGNKYITTYYRKTIIVTNAASSAELLLRVQRDDGIAVYLNGVGAYTNNLPATFDYTTFAPATISGADETNWQSASIPASLLADGSNVVAVELHQRNGSSTDVTFNLELKSLIPGTLDLIAPSVPGGLQAFAIGTNRVQVGWSPALDNAGGSGLGGYLLYRDGVLFVTNASASYVDSPVEPASNYCYRVAAYDLAGNTSAQSAAICITPASADADGDGLPDWWEHAFFGHVTGAAAGADADGDGQNNSFEYRSLTDPTNHVSRFEFWIEYLAGETNPVHLLFRPRWEARSYTVNVSLNLVDWAPLTNNATTDTGNERRVVDLDLLGDHRFYRVAISNAPPNPGARFHQSWIHPD